MCHCSWCYCGNLLKTVQQLDLVPFFLSEIGQTRFVVKSGVATLPFSGTFEMLSIIGKFLDSLWEPSLQFRSGQGSRQITDADSFRNAQTAIQAGHLILGLGIWVWTSVTVVSISVSPYLSFLRLIMVDQFLWAKCFVPFSFRFQVEAVQATPSRGGGDCRGLPGMPGWDTCGMGWLPVAACGLWHCSRLLQLNGGRCHPSVCPDAPSDAPWRIMTYQRSDWRLLNAFFIGSRRKGSTQV